MKTDLTLHRVITDRKIPIVDTWERPADWLPMPTSFSEEYPEVAILYAVFEGMPALTDFITYSSQAYQIDWGDGVVETKASGEKSSHTYDFAALPESSRCSRGYKQVIIRLTSLNNTCSYEFNSATNQPYNHYFLEFLVSSIDNSNSSFRYIGATPARLLERFVGGDVVGSALYNTLKGCTALESVSMGQFIGNTESFFDGCYNLKFLSFTGYTTGTSYDSMFKDCSRLEQAPPPPPAGDLNSLYRNMSFKEFTGDISGNSGLRSMFSGCSKLKKVALIGNLPAYIDLLFYGCLALEDINDFTLNASTDSLASMFYNCKLLKKIPFSTCPTTVKDFNNFADGCESLLEIPALDASGNTNTFGNFARNCYKLSRCRMTGINNTISFLNAGLSREAIVEIFNNLATVSAKTITITGTPGAAALTQAERDIALNKGWTITG